jgi:hypothetical protein
MQKTQYASERKLDKYQELFSKILENTTPPLYAENEP